MLIGPELIALRADDRPQRQIQGRLVAQLAEWRGCGQGAQLEAELQKLAEGAPLGELALLSALFNPDTSDASEIVGQVLGWLLAELAEAPLGQVPLRHQCDRVLATLVLARCHGASLAIQAIDGAGLALRTPAQSVAFAANETWERILAGSVETDRVRIVGQQANRAQLHRSSARHETGSIQHRRGQEAADIFTRVPGVAVLLKLQRLGDVNVPSREYALDDGRLLHQAAGSPRDSRLELAATLLGRMGRSDAAPLLAAMAEESGSPALRWQALRECLGLDSGLGYSTLSSIAHRSEDPLSVPAAALRAQLLEAHPQLAEVS